MRVENLTKDSCTLSWQPPEQDGGAEVTGYYVEMTSGYSSRFRRVNKQPISAQYFECDLDEGETYEFQVCAENVAGVGPPSESSGKITAKNPFDVPGKPEAPLVTSQGPKGVILTWEAPASDGGAAITSYVTQARRMGDLKWKQALGESGNLLEKSWDVTDLKDMEKYEFRVAATNKAGTGEFSNPSKVHKFGEFFS